MMNHELPDCMLVWYHPYLLWKDCLDNGEEICEQGWADLQLSGINEVEARSVRRK